jgi:hypothetical protein
MSKEMSDEPLNEIQDHSSTHGHDGGQADFYRDR